MTSEDDAVHTVVLCLHVADPATSLSSQCRGTLFPLRAARLYYHLLNIVNMTSPENDTILDPFYFSANRNFESLKNDV